MPIVSIVMPAFNAARTIQQSIDSVLAQTFKNWELLIVDDCSTDETSSLVSNHVVGDKRIRLLNQPKNGGPARARNAALNVATGRYIAFLDSDDCWLPQKLERQLQFMQQRKSALSYTFYRRFSDDIERAGALVAAPESFGYSDLLKNTGIACLTVMVDREQCGGFEFKVIRHEDYVLWLELLKRGFRADGLMEDLARYRVSTTSVSGNKLKSALWVWNVYRNVEHLTLSRSLWCFGNYAWKAFHKQKRLAQGEG